MIKKLNKGLTYKDSGVDINVGNALVETIKPFVKETHDNQVIGSIGGFGALFALDTLEYKEPILVSATDGVGTKLKFAINHNKHDSIGEDLVAMCANDLIVQGAKPLFFLDYFATAKLELATAVNVIKSIAQGCKLAQCSLIGGETAEMPGMYHNKDYDLAGFCVGVVEKSKIISGQDVKAGDICLGIESSGLHSNGYSLIHKLLESNKIDVTKPVQYKDLESKPLLDYLLEPTKIYVASILDLIKSTEVHAIAHITGGGITENLPRVLPKNTRAEINLKDLFLPPLFSYIQDQGNISDEEMLKTLNCGCGMILVVDKNNVDISQKILAKHSLASKVIGKISNCTEISPSVYYI